ncbi:sorting and assembly machinery component 50 putativ [Nannochloropsis oceanica]
MVRADTPLRINRVVVEGNKRTDPSVIEDELQEAYRASTVEGVHRGLQRATQSLQSLGIFHGIDIQMQEAASQNPGETDLLIKVAEKGIFTAYTGTSFTRDDINFEASGSLRNPTGYAESVEGTYSRSRLGNRSVRVNLSKPRVRGANVRLDCELHEDTLNYERTSSLREKVQALAFHLTTHNRRHRLTYEMALRDILPRRHLSTPFAYDASLSIMREATPSLKSAFKYKFIDDRRNDGVLPTGGTFFSGLLELAGLGVGDVAYVKAEVAGATHKPLGVGGICAHLSGVVGVVRPTSWRMREGVGEEGVPRTRFSDRYVLGGLQTMRGFGYSGLGPRAARKEGGCLKGDSLGGDLKYVATAALTMPVPLPLLDKFGLRWQVFADAGNLLPWSAPLASMLSDMRLSCGTGLAMSLGAARVELNYSLPFKRKGSDLEQRWQFGLAAHIG